MGYLMWEKVSKVHIIFRTGNRGFATFCFSCLLFTLGIPPFWQIIWLFGIMGYEWEICIDDSPYFPNYFTLFLPNNSMV